MIKKLNAKRILIMLLALLTVAAFTPLAGPGQSYAASKKTVWLVTSETHTYTFSKDDVEKWTVKNTYNKKGLLTKTTSTNPHTGGNTKSLYKRTAKGAVKSINTFNGKEKISTTQNTVNKKGLITKSKEYNFVDGKKTLYSTTTNTYWGNGNIKKSVYKSDDFKSTSTYRKNGTIKKSTFSSDYGSSTTTYNKKGRAIKEVETSGADDYKTTTTTTYKYTTNKKGHVTKEVATEKEKDINGNVTTSKGTRTYKYKYDSHGNILKITTKYKHTGEYEATSTSTSTYKYKKVKVLKKYLPYI